MSTQSSWIMPRTNQKWRGAPKGVSWQSRSWCFAEKVTLFIFGSKTKWEKRKIPRETRQSRGGETIWFGICCWLREPGALVTRSKDTSSLAFERFLTIFRFLWSGLTLGFYPRRLFLLRTLHQRARAKSKLLQRVMIMRCKQNMQIRDAQCNSRSRMSFGTKNVIALLDA